MIASFRVPADAAARAVGADAIAAAVGRAQPGLPVVRTGSRGAHFLEPLLEAVHADGRVVAYGPLTAADVPSVLAAIHGDEAHPLCVGDPAEHPFLAAQTRVTFARCGVVDPGSLDDYRRTGGLRGVEHARAMGPDAIIDAVTRSGLRGRGGAGFPAGIKWRTVRDAPSASGRKTVVCNADEGDSGTFADRMLLEGDPFALLEGIAIAALAVGADEGWIYLRSEYPDAERALHRALAASRDVWGVPIHLRLGAGAYVCGEETALLESLEGRRGQVRPKPPLPAHHGFFGRPTVVNNVLTLAAVPDLMAPGAAPAYAALGTGRSRGTLAVQLGGNVRFGGLVEVPFGITLGQLVLGVGGGTASGRPVKAVQVGGPLGAWFPPALFDTPLDFEAFTARGGLVGHGGVVVADDTADMAELAEFAFAFAAHESCGKCTPCRIGSVRGRETLARVRQGHSVEAGLELVMDLCNTLEFGSLCALGGLLPMPVRSAITHFPHDFMLGPGQGT